MTIGIMGSSGFIGTYLTKMALDKGDKVIGWDLVKPREDYKNDNFIFRQWENGDFDLDIGLKECDGVVILAAKRPYREFTLNDYFYNIEIVMKALERCGHLGVKNIVVISSRSVYSDSSLPWKEERCNTPLNLYGAAKAAVDDIVRLYNREYELSIKSLRLAQVLGMGERKGYLLNTFIDKAIKKETLPIYGTGLGKRQYIYIKDVVSAIFAALASQKGGVYNIGMEGSISTLELAEIINHVFENEGNIQIYKDKEEDLQNKEMDVRKAFRELGWRAEYTMKTALHDIKNEISEEKDGHAQ